MVYFLTTTNQVLRRNNMSQNVRVIMSADDIKFEDICNLMQRRTNQNFSSEQKSNLRKFFDTLEDKDKIKLFVTLLDEQEKKT